MIRSLYAPGRFTLRCLLLTLVALVVTSAGCSSELDPGKPGDAYLLFRDALFAGDAQAVWNRTDEETREHFQVRYEQLVEMGKLINRYLPQTDHRLARRQSGAELTDSVTNGEALFLKVFTPAELPRDEAIRFGSEVHEIQMAEDGNTAVIVTRSEQEFVVVKARDGQWYVNLLESGDVLASSFAWLDQNASALEQTVEDLMAEERRKREAIIAELLNLK